MIVECEKIQKYTVLDKYNEKNRQIVVIGVKKMFKLGKFLVMGVTVDVLNSVKVKTLQR